jgi:hypothetical protein
MMKLCEIVQCTEDDELGRKELLVKSERVIKFNNCRVGLVPASFGKNLCYLNFSELKKFMATGK